MPPVTGFGVISDTLVTLLEEISKLRREVELLKESRCIESTIAGDNVSIKEVLHELKSDIRGLNIQMSRSEISKSRTRKADQSDELNFRAGMQEETAILQLQLPSAPPWSQDLPNARTPLCLDEGQDESDLGAVGGEPENIFAGWANAAKQGLIRNGENGVKPKTKGIFQQARIERKRTPDEPTHLREEHKKTDQEGFTLVQRRRQGNKGITGTKKVNDSSRFKSAKRFVDLYVGRCDLNVKSEDIINFIKEELKIEVISITELKSRNTSMNSFKFSVDLINRDTLLSEDVWPEGIICRKFFSPRTHNNPQND
ncbi:unnamed protein product [Rotaria socialis]|uniref:Uncharacterized protein n=1 Tax=Rotaria socialis TaxID=392032 RepID=A0A818ZZ30_9BILA|nr:unnamed protein product [Rotaria socialis]